LSAAWAMIARVRGSLGARGALAMMLVSAAVALSVVPGAGAQPFTQCPPVDADKSCQFLVTITDAGPSVAADPTQGPYEGSDDSLIGVQNNSSAAIAALPLSAPGTSLFGFESDGICDPGAGPLPPGCVPVPGSPAGTTCGSQSVACSFPPPPGEPPNYTEAGATGALPWPNGDRQNGYEGPTSWFSGITPDTSGGTVNFSPPIQPGGSTYFSLESPPNAAAIQVGTPTTTPPAGGKPKLPPAFGPNGVIRGLPSTKKCFSKRHFVIHIRRYAGITYLEVIVFVNHRKVSVVKHRASQFTAAVNLRGLPPGTFPVKITVITTTGAIISGTRKYKTCHKKVVSHLKGRL
jgi:hypothetical protein